MPNSPQLPDVAPGRQQLPPRVLSASHAKAPPSHPSHHCCQPRAISLLCWKYTEQCVSPPKLFPCHSLSPEPSLSHSCLKKPYSSSKTHLKCRFLQKDFSGVLRTPGAVFMPLLQNLKLGVHPSSSFQAESSWMGELCHCIFSRCS